MKQTEPVVKSGSEVAKGRYMPGLDGLRALAVIAVIAYHLDMGWAPGGFMGVGIFFVLSGYLITDLLIRQWKHTGRIDLRQFWIRRARRLLPAQLLLLIALLIWILLFHKSRLADWWGDWAASLIYVTNWWFIWNNVSYYSLFEVPTPLLHLWSLAVEEQFYLVWPLLLLLGLLFIRNRKVLFVLMLIAALASALAMALLYHPGLLDTSRVYYGTDTRAFALLLGAALALIWPSEWPERFVSHMPLRIALDLIGVAGLAVLLYLIWQTNLYGDFLYRGGMVLQCLSTLAVIAAAVHPSSLISRILGWRLLRWLGIRSYGIYLWHYPVIVLTFTNTEATSGRSLFYIFIQIAVVLLIASISWRFIEKPIRYGTNKREWG